MYFNLTMDHEITTEKKQNIIETNNLVLEKEIKPSVEEGKWPGIEISKKLFWLGTWYKLIVPSEDYSDSVLEVYSDWNDKDVKHLFVKLVSIEPSDGWPVEAYSTLYYYKINLSEI